MAEEKTSCVLRLFGAPQGQLAGAVGQFAPQWKTQAQWKSRGGETLLALQAASPSGLKKAAQSLQAQFEADLYGAGDTSLAAAVVNALETHDRLLVLLLLAVLGAAVWYQYAMGGDWAKLAQLPQRIQTQGLDALKNFWQAYQPKPGTELI